MQSGAIEIDKLKFKNDKRMNICPNCESSNIKKSIIFAKTIYCFDCHNYYFEV